MAARAGVGVSFFWPRSSTAETAPPTPASPSSPAGPTRASAAVSTPCSTPAPLYYNVDLLPERLGLHDAFGVYWRSQGLTSSRMKRPTSCFVIMEGRGAIVTDGGPTLDAVVQAKKPVMRLMRPSTSSATS